MNWQILPNPSPEEAVVNLFLIVFMWLAVVIIAPNMNGFCRLAETVCKPENYGKIGWFRR